MPSSRIIVGARVATEVDFRVGGALADPTTVRCIINSPLVTLPITYEFPVADMTRLGIGQYRFEFTVDSAGSWAIRWEGSGAVEGVDEAVMVVDPSAVL